MSQIPGSADGGPDFRFPNARRKDDHWLEDGFKGDDEIEHQPVFQAYIQDDYSAYSPPLWKTSTTSPDIQPLLPVGHPCSNLSPRSVTRAIASSREEMMKMIKDLPESSYELSLKDIVDLRISQEAKVEPTIEEEPGFRPNPQQAKKPKRKMTRSDSMDNSAVLIKTFFPSFSMPTRKLVPGNISRIIPRSSSSSAGSQRSTVRKHPTDKFLEEATRLASSNNNNNKLRHEDDKQEATGCWPSINPRKLKTWRKFGCLL